MEILELMDETLQIGKPCRERLKGGSVAIRKQVFGSVTITPSLCVCYKKEPFVNRERVPSQRLSSQTSFTTATTSKSLAITKVRVRKVCAKPRFFHKESAASLLLALKLLGGSVQMWVVLDTTRFERIDADARISTMLDNTQPFTRAMTLAALTGLKLTLGPAFFMTANRRPGSRNWVLAAMGEMVLDKVGGIPSRSSLPLIIPRTLAGAWVAHESMKEDGVENPWAAPMGAVVAAGVATIAPMLRITGSRALSIPDILLGLAEDYIALKLGSEAMNMPMNEVVDTAKETIGEFSESYIPALSHQS